MLKIIVNGMRKGKILLMFNIGSPQPKEIMKSTDSEITVAQKINQKYFIENTLHVIKCINTMYMCVSICTSNHFRLRRLKSVLRVS